ncbi:uncharacterized protein LOC144994542 [Oryzias latipes]
MNSRINFVERAVMPSSPGFTVPASSSLMPAALPDHALLDPAGVGAAPPRTLETAVPAPPLGSRFIPPAAAIPANLRANILKGNDINLVKILLCGSSSSDLRVVDCGDVSVVLKDSDPRLDKGLTLAEFVVAFGVFRDVICEVYPHRREELDVYLAIISDLALSYGGSLFYDYHKSFSAKAAMYVQKFNQRLDWSVVDLALMSRHFTGHRTLTCSVCGSFSHSTSLCPKTAMRALSITPAQPSGSAPPFLPRGQVPFRSRSRAPLCHFFNEGVCVYPNCKYMHVCSVCADSHPRSVCPRRVRSKPSGN